MPTTEVTPYALFHWDRRFYVPDFQRPFSWSTEEVRDLWTDLLPVVAGAQKELFLGTIVLETSQTGKAIIWDGQQRLATIVMVLAACRDRLRVGPIGTDPGLAAEIDLAIVGGALAPTRTPAIMLGETDDKTFREFALLAPGDPAKKGAAFWKGIPITKRRSEWSPRVVEAVTGVQQLVGDFATDGAKTYGGEVEAIKQLLAAVLHKIRMVKFETVSEDEAFRLFEVLNDRGLELSAADLIKNFLLSRVGASPKLRAEMKQKWDGMSRTIGSERLTAYIRHFYMSRYGRTTKNDLYDRIRDLCSGTPTPMTTPSQLLSDIGEGADLYARVTSDDGGAWPSASLGSSLDTLRRLGATQWIPLVLAAQSLGLGEAEYEKIARAAEVLFIRSVAVAGKNPNSLDRLFADAASAMWKSGSPTAAAGVRQAALTGALATVRASTPPDAEFRDRLNELSDLPGARVRMILEKLESQIQFERKGGALPHLKILDMEHIYPETDGKEWPSPGSPGYVSEPDRQRLGNLTLLHLARNRAQKNSGFIKKQPAYASSALEITKEVAAYPKWDLASIKDRQTRLADIAIRAWPLT
jgi:Protein of unknown function DUF262/Protein of unknown function (DUF1524)